MVLLSRGQLLAQQTSVVDESQHLLKSNSSGCGDLGMMSHRQSPVLKEGMWLKTLFVYTACVVCCRKRYKTCDHIFVGGSFINPRHACVARVKLLRLR